MHLMAQKLISCGTILDCPDLKYYSEESVDSSVRLGEQGWRQWGQSHPTCLLMAVPRSSGLVGWGMVVVPYGRVWTTMLSLTQHWGSSVVNNLSIKMKKYLTTKRSWSRRGFFWGKMWAQLGPVVDDLMSLLVNDRGHMEYSYCQQPKGWSHYITAPLGWA
jgi:hypothetical protein